MKVMVKVMGEGDGEDLYLRLCSSAEHGLQPLHEIFNFSLEGCVLQGGRHHHQMDEGEQ